MNDEILYNIKTRKPIISQETAEQYIPEKMELKWKLLTEAIRRGILDNPEIKSIVVDFVKSPVNEILPKELLNKLLLGNESLKLKKIYRKKLMEYLNLEPVPEDQINPDIRKAKSLTEPKNVIEILEKRLLSTKQKKHFIRNAFFDCFLYFKSLVKLNFS